MNYLFGSIKPGGMNLSGNASAFNSVDISSDFKFSTSSDKFFIWLFILYKLCLSCIFFISDREKEEKNQTNKPITAMIKNTINIAFLVKGF